MTRRLELAVAAVSPIELPGPTSELRVISKPKAITAVICTRGRGDAVRLAAGSVLACSHPDFEVLVIDQSSDDSSERALADLFSDPRFTYVRSTSVGVSRARNDGLRRARSEFVAFTDDDCEVSEGWLEAMQAVLEEHEDAAAVFCAVRPGPHDASAGFVPGFECDGTQVFRRFSRRLRGMGAGLAVRRQILIDLGGFDEELGPGSRFPACEDRDVVVRAIIAEHAVCTTDRTFVIHHGFRSWDEGRSLSQRDFIGIGAACAKPLRAGHWKFAPMALHEILAESLWPPVNDLLHFRRAFGKLRALHFLRGFWGGVLTPLDTGKLVFARNDASRHAPMA
jgi:glycosyltransferase involved in cell wall biosynthesis